MLTEAAVIDGGGQGFRQFLVRSELAAFPPPQSPHGGSAQRGLREPTRVWHGVSHLGCPRAGLFSLRVRRDPCPLEAATLLPSHGVCGSGRAPAGSGDL